MDELQSLKDSVNRLTRRLLEVEEQVSTVEKSSKMMTAKLSLLKEGVQNSVSAIKDVGHDLDVFLDIYTDEREKLRSDWTV